ncbi:MAG: Tn3 family transposase [Cyclobacteriaceae bacterium]
MPVLNIFNESERIAFDGIPKLDDKSRAVYFNLESRDPDKDYFRKEELLVGYILLKGYFLATGRFHLVKNFRSEDVQFICDKYGLTKDRSLHKYPKTSYKRHKDLICKKYEITSFKDWKRQFILETDQLVKTALKPKQIISHLVDILRERGVEIPGYFVFAEIISNSLNQFENDLTDKINSILTNDQKNTLDEILTLPQTPGEPISSSNPYFLTTIKKPEQNEAPRKIKKSLEEFETIDDLFQEFSGILNQLDVSDQLLNYYAVWLIKSKHVSFLAISDPNKKYLYLLSFILYQFRIRQDLFMDTYLKAIQRFKNEVEKSIAKDFLDQKPVRNEQTRKIIRAVRSLTDQFDRMRTLTYSNQHSDSEKIFQIKNAFEEWDQSKEDRLQERKRLEKELVNLELSISSGLKEQMLIDKYIGGYRRLNNRVGGILRILNFNRESSNKDIIEAIDFLKQDRRSTKSKWPVRFINDRNRKTIKELEDAPAFSLYKVLLFIEISNHIKAGSLNLSNSDKYRAVEEYLIAEDEWRNHKETLMRRAGLNLESTGTKFIQRLKYELDSQYEKTNQDVHNNEFLSFTNSGKPKVVTPKVDKDEDNGLLPLLGEEDIIPLPRILAEINRSSNFLESFEHFSQKNFQKPPDQYIFYATIIALGCNLGIRRMSKISKGISLDRLNYLHQWYINKENLDRAIAKINDCINQLSLPALYKKVGEETHTSSDGQKFNVSVPSINASYSYKYFGSGKGITAYSFIDDYSRLYYNTVISASEREAAYVVDGLMHNEDVESDIHSTDTHGYSEIVFAITNGLGVFFAPRIKNYNDQLLYTFRESKKLYEQKDFPIKPTAPKYIDENLIIEQWESILRVIITIKLRRTTASRILKRLSSYSKQHPLYRALKQVGRIYKTIFILKYFDDINLRQSTEKALNRIEQSHQFAKAIFFGNNQELKQSSKEEQEISIGARHLIQNAIVLWNYLKISDVLLNAGSNERFQEILDVVKSGSIMTWQHINIHGEYDFELLELDENHTIFQMEKILALNIN